MGSFRLPLAGAVQVPSSMFDLGEDETCPIGASSSQGITSVPSSEAVFTTSIFIRCLHAPRTSPHCCLG